MGESEGIIQMRSWCFDSQAVENNGLTTYDREYGSAEIREVVKLLIGNGVYANPATNMQVTAGSGMTVTVQPGFCWISGAMGAVDEAETLTIDTGSSGRVDLIVARFDLALAYRSIRLAVIPGTEGSSSPPSLTRNESTYDIQLARINVRAGASSVLQSDIVDTRYNAGVCGIVTGIINQIDATNLFSQFQSVFDQFMTTLETTLSGDVAGNLLTLITTHTDDKNNPHEVTKEQVGLGKVADERQYSANNQPPYPVTSVNGQYGNVSLTKNDVGLGNVLNEKQFCETNLPSNAIVKSIEIPADDTFSTSIPSTAWGYNGILVATSWPRNNNSELAGGVTFLSGLNIGQKGMYATLKYPGSDAASSDYLEITLNPYDSDKNLLFSNRSSTKSVNVYIIPIVKNRGIL